ncbi:hypothetical protein SteCoe_25089 [Stentor coeruleus]|uniref:non-specific serine/threonine protein kinase n=1 Tax=Stentor coeruleus TaxID=5963 RepID=A0A1R2BG62_9CILI|nr:hypothetical protein SteCoe_25089 [Stentor coeruleus]
MGACTAKFRHHLREDHSLAEYTFTMDIKKVYNMQEYCGSGHYGTVTRATLIADPSQQFAIKKISKDFIRNTDHLRREVEILSALHHPNIIKIYETYQDLKYFYIVMQYCGGGTLLSRISSASRYSEKSAAIILDQMIRAVMYLHSKGICHRDIKPENFLFSSEKPNAKLKLIDFGVSQKFGKWMKNMKEMIGTIYYVAPEVIQGNYDEKCDNWSIGVIMYLLLCGSLPFNAKSEDLIIHRILHSEIHYDYKIWGKISPEGRDLVQRLLTKSSECRISMEEAYKHPWFFKNYGENDNFSPLDNLQDYAYKEELVVKITNHMLNTLNYKEIKAAADDIDKLSQHFLCLQVFENIVCCSFQISDKTIMINAKKILRGALSAKQHLNEEKLWKVFNSFDVTNSGRLYMDEIKKMISMIEGKNKHDLKEFSKRVSLNFEDVMKLYDQGKLLHDIVN